LKIQKVRLLSLDDFYMTKWKRENSKWWFWWWFLLQWFWSFSV